MGILIKLLKWIPVNLLSVLGIIQAIVKLIKEIVTAIVNVLFPVIPSEQFKKVVETVRGIINSIDSVIEKIKEFLLQVVR